VCRVAQIRVRTYSPRAQPQRTSYKHACPRDTSRTHTHVYTDCVQCQKRSFCNVKAPKGYQSFSTHRGVQGLTHLLHTNARVRRVCLPQDGSADKNCNLILVNASAVYYNIVEKLEGTVDWRSPLFNEAL